LKTFRIGMVGGFDVANFGDLLFPLVAREELARRLSQVEIRPFSYHARSAPAWPFDVIPLERLATELPSLDLLLVGGGDIIRFDSHVARGYLPSSPRIHHPTGFWLAPILMAHAANVPVVWNAPGLPGPIPRWARAIMRASVAVSAYVSVRDAASRDLLGSIVPDSHVELVPDTGFNAAALLAEAPGTHDTEPFLVVQSRPDWRRWLPGPPAHGRPRRFVLTPVGPIIGDVVHAPRVLPDGTTFAPPLDPYELLDLIARSSGVVGPSLHLTIAALSLGRPAFRPRSVPRRKYGMLEGLVGVRHFDQRAPEGLDVSASGALAPDPAQLAEIRGRLERHWDTVASLVRSSAANPRSPGSSTALLVKLWEGIPATLEHWSTAEVLRGLLRAGLERLGSYR
jgi:homopolymeric O-antigen transport system ATP-binding protein